MISSEINEIVGISDKIYTMRRGKITAKLEKAENYSGKYLKEYFIITIANGKQGTVR